MGTSGSPEYANQAIGRITPQGQAREFPLPYDAALGAAGFPSGIAAGPDRNLWFVRRNGAVGRITPQGDVTEFHDGITGFTMQVTATELPNGIAAGPDGALWFTEPDGVIGRITTQGAVTEFRDGITTYYGSELGTLAAIAAGPDGNLWFTDPQGAIGRITTQGAVTEFRDGISAGAVPAGIVAGPDGNLWFGERAGRVGRITSQGVVSEFAAGANSNPTAVTRGPDNAVWYAASDRVGRLARAASTPDRVRPRIRLGALRGRRLTLTVSERVVLTARHGRHRFRASVRAGRRTVRLPAWLVAAASRGVRLTATDRAGNAAAVVLRAGRTRRRR